MNVCTTGMPWPRASARSASEACPRITPLPAEISGNDAASISRAAVVAGDSDERCVIEIGVGNTGCQVRRARAEGGQAHARATRQPAVGVGHERGPLLVAREHEADA